MEELQALAQVRALCQSGAARTARLAADISLSEIAGPVGVAPSTIHRWETGGRRPTGQAALRYGELLAELLSRGRVRA